MASAAGERTTYVSSNKKRYRNTMLLLAVVTALLSVLGLCVALHKLRAGRAVGLLLQDRERQLLTLHMVLQKERARSNQMKTKIQELKAKAVALRTQKMQLKAKLMAAETQATHLRQKLASLNDAAEEASTQLADLRVAALTDQLKQQQPRPADDAAEEVERRPQQPDANATPLVPHDHDGVSSNGINIDDQSANINYDPNATGEGEIMEIDAPGDRGDDHGQTTTTTGTDSGTVTGAGGGSGGGGGVDQEGGEHEEQGSEGGKWVRLETNVDDGAHDSADNGDGGSVGEDRGKVEGEHQVGEVAPESDRGREVLLKGEGTTSSQLQVGDESRAPAGDGEQGQATTDATDQTDLDNGTTGGTAGTTGADQVAIATRYDVVESSNTTEIISASTSTTVTAASDEGDQEGNDKLQEAGKEDDHKYAGEGTHEEKQTTAETQISISADQVQPTSAHHDQVQTDAAAEEQSRGTTTAGGLELATTSVSPTSTDDDGNNISETGGSWNAGSYPGTNGSELKGGTTDADVKVGFDVGGEQEKISTGATEGSNTSGGARQEDARLAAEASEESINIRSTTEASDDLVAAALPI